MGRPGRRVRDARVRAATGGDTVFRGLVLARIIEPTSKVDAARVLEEVGVSPAGYATVKRRLLVYAEASWRQGLAAACARHAALGPASLVPPPDDLRAALEQIGLPGAH